MTLIRSLVQPSFKPMLCGRGLPVTPDNTHASGAAAGIGGDMNEHHTDAMPSSGRRRKRKSAEPEGDSQLRME
jgi:hypothetical protein